MYSRKTATDTAKRCLANNIYTSARVEGIIITFLQVQQILANLPVNGIRWMNLLL